MSEYISENHGKQAKKKWVITITALTLSFLVVGLLVVSVVSFFQTLQAFLPLNDSSIVLWGIPLGEQIAVAFALIFQYGQNAALFVRSNYCENKKIADFGIFELTDTMLTNIIFGICAAIDAGTNIMWLDSKINTSQQHFLIRSLEYTTMIAIVFVEEVLGIVIQSLYHSLTDLKILKSRESKSHQPSREPAYRSEQTQPRTAFPVQNQPKKGQGRGFQESHRVERGNYKSSDKPNPFGKFGE